MNERPIIEIVKIIGAGKNGAFLIKMECLNYFSLGCYERNGGKNEIGEQPQIL